MARIGVLSDTHLPDSGEAQAFLIDLAERFFAGVDLLLHAGDIVDHNVLAVLTAYPVYAVRGNMDSPASGLPHKRVVTVDGQRIGLIHGWGAPAGMVRQLLGEFSGSPLDCLVFGHSHVPMCRRDGGILLFNPGSATQRRGMPRPSIGLLETGNGTISGRIIPLEV